MGETTKGFGMGCGLGAGLLAFLLVIIIVIPVGCLVVGMIGVGTVAVAVDDAANEQSKVKKEQEKQMAKELEKLNNQVAETSDLDNADTDKNSEKKKEELPESVKRQIAFKDDLINEAKKLDLKTEKTTHKVPQKQPQLSNVSNMKQWVADSGVAMKVNTGWRSNKQIGLDVTIKNILKESESYNRFYFKLKDGDGFSYNTATNLDATGKTFNSGEISKGEMARGWLYFDVESDAKNLILEYSPITFRDIYKLKVTLGTPPITR